MHNARSNLISESSFIAKIDFFLIKYSLIVSLSWVSFWLRADATPRVTLGRCFTHFNVIKRGIIQRGVIVIIFRHQYDVDIYHIECGT